MVDHAWVQENLDTYLTGDLTTDERENVERHVADCDTCKQALAEARQLEQVMNGLFVDARPDAYLENRLIEDLRKEPIRSFQWPKARRIAVAAAAVLVVGLIGAVAQAISMNALPFSATPLAGGDTVIADRSVRSKQVGSQKEPGGHANVDLAAEFEKDFQASSKRLLQLTVPEVDSDGFAIKLEADTNLNKAIAKQKIDESVTLDGQAMEVLKQSLNSGKVDEKIKDFREKTTKVNDKVESKERTDQRKIMDTFYDREGLQKTPESDLKLAFDAFYKGRPMDPMKVFKDPETLNKTAGEKKEGFLGQKEKETPDGGGKDKLKLPISDPSVTFRDGTMPGMGLFKPSVPSAVPVPSALPGPGYFPLPTSPLVPTAPPVPIAKDDGKGDKEGDSKKPADESDKGPGKKSDPTPVFKPKAVDPPMETNRKIIRTGEMEFETESFDKAVDKISRLIAGESKEGAVLLPAIPGAFVATINSDKLANGKMRGSIVVRMPPQFLDKFILDLRRELAKSGELKNQRIISLDVTKQYTDIESRVRAARTMEDRLIQIIKTGKGEIKDLVAAERELGVWRTKIEEMEGEIRYYANQVSLSTLTISLYEKEILAPTALVVTENVRMRLEVDDVAKAHQTAMNAVEEVKGRITKSELKQHSAGQLQSILHADIPPAKKDAFRDKLKKLGILSDHQENQQQHTEGGSGRGPELKPRQDDVRFEVTMHNTANVRPRLTADLKIATGDVAGDYAKLLEAITKAKGQVRDGRLNEQDKLNITASLDFNVPIAEKPAIDKVIFDIGPVLERVNVQAPISELSTAQKFGYTLLLRDFASIPPSRAAIEVVATMDVPASYAKVQEAIAKFKGQIADAKLNEQDKLNINAQIDFTIPSEEKTAVEKLLIELGTSLSRTNVQAPLKQLSTARKFGYSLILRDFASIPPSKSAIEVIATMDVPASYAKVQEAIAKLKGQIADAKLNEQDKLNINAQIDFSVPSEEKTAVEKLFKELGTSLSRTNMQTPMNQLSTPKKFGYTLLLRDFASIPPSKAVVEIIAVSDVPASYAKVQEALVKFKGQVVDAKLNEQDKLNINAQFDFTILIEEKLAIEAMLKELGASLSRTNVQTPMNQLATPKKFGYTLVLRDFASIPPSKATELKVATSDVPANYVKLTEAILKAEGHIIDAKLNEQDKLHITARLAFSVPLEEKATIDKLLTDIGTILSRTNVQAPVNQLSSAKKFGYSLDLRDFANIPPTQTSEVKIAASNVPGNYAKLLEAIVKAKGQIRDSKLNEQDKLNVVGQIDFSVPSAEKPAIEELLAKIGTILSRNNMQAPVTELSTDGKFGYFVVLRDFANIPPRETFILQIALQDVATSFRELQEAVIQAKGWVNVGKLVEDNKAKIEAQFDFDVPASEKQALEKMLTKAGAVLSRTSSQLPVNDLATDQKVGYRLTLRSTASIPPREKVMLKFEVTDVDAQASALKEQVVAAKGKVIDSDIVRHENGQVTANFVFEVPFASQDTLIRQMKSFGKPVSQRSVRNAQVQENDLTTSHILVTLTGSGPYVPPAEGITSYVRTTLYLSFRILAMIVMTIIVGLSGILPCVIIIWIGFKLYTMTAGASQGRPAFPPLTPLGSGSKLIAQDDKPSDSDPAMKP